MKRLNAIYSLPFNGKTGVLLSRPRRCISHRHKVVLKKWTYRPEWTVAS
jgi:hypothetical protein